MIKAIETEYKGYKFRSRLEARWAVFFDAMGIAYEYEPEGFMLDDGTKYLPDFYIHIKRRHYDNEICPDGCYVEVKGNMSAEDLRKIKLFSKHYPIIVLGNIPENSMEYVNAHDEIYNSYGYIDGDDYCAMFSKYNGDVWIAGGDHDQYDLGKSMDIALKKARQARFEHGETPM